MTVKELKEWLNICDDNANVIIDYACNDDYYNYYGSDIEISFNGNNIELQITD